MDDQQRLKLKEMLKANDVEDQTSRIRELKHSQKIKEDVETMQRFKVKYQRLRQTNYNQYDQMMSSQCNFLFTNYTDIFNKLRKDELDLTTNTQPYIYCSYQIYIMIIIVSTSRY